MIAAVASEVNTVNIIEQKMDKKATRHICSSKKLFLNYKEVIDGPSTNLEDAHTTLLAGQRKILLKLTSGNSLALKFALHAPHIRRNLVYESSLNKVGTMFDASKLVVNYNWWTS